MMIEHGLVQKWSKVHFGPDHCSGGNGTDARATSLMDVAGPFVFLVAGSLVATTVLAAEVFFAAVWCRRQQFSVAAAGQNPNLDSENADCIE